MHMHQVIPTMPVLAILMIVGFFIFVVRWIPHHFILGILGIGFLLFMFGTFRARQAEQAVRSVAEQAEAEFSKHSRWGSDTSPDDGSAAPGHAVKTARETPYVPQTASAVPQVTPVAPPAVDSTASTPKPGASPLLPANPEPTPRPAWVGQAPHLEERDGQEIYFDTVTLGPYSTTEECDRELNPAVNRRVRAYAEGHFPGGAEVGLDSDYLESHLIQARWRETITTTLGPMQQEHLLLAFDRGVRGEIEHRCRELMIGQRLDVAAEGAAAVLLVVGGFYTLLRWGPGRRPRAAVS